MIFSFFLKIFSDIISFLRYYSSSFFSRSSKMKKIIGKIALYMAGTGVLLGNAAATKFVSMTSGEYSSNDFPDSEALTSGKLSPEPKNFYLACTGKCEKNADVALEFEGCSIPNFFSISAGRLIYASPEAMCQISLKSLRRTIAIRLNNIQVNNKDDDSISTEEDNFKKHVYLGIKEGETITNRIREKQVAYADVSETDIVELVPILTTAGTSEKLSAEKDVEESALIKDVISSLPDADFDFTTVFRLQVKGYEIVSDADFSSKITWSVSNHTTSLESACSGGSTHWYNQGAGLGVGMVHGELRMLAIHNDTGKLGSSADGKVWRSEGTVFDRSDGEPDASNSGWQIAPVYGNGVWCVISKSGAVRYCTDKDGKFAWTMSSTPPADTSGASDNNTLGIAFGGQGDSKVFLTICKDGKAWTSPNGQSWTSAGKVVYTNNGNEIRAFCYDQHNENWVAFTNTGSVYRSADSTGSGDWNLIDSQNLNGIIDKYWFCSFYARGHLWLHNSDGYVAVSSDGINWYKSSNANFGGAFSMTFFNNELYILKMSGNACVIGTFEDPF